MTNISIPSELMNIQKELNATLEELKTAQDSYDTDSAKWEKEKAELQVLCLLTRNFYTLNFNFLNNLYP